MKAVLGHFSLFLITALRTAERSSTCGERLVERVRKREREREDDEARPVPTLLIGCPEPAAPFRGRAQSPIPPSLRRIRKGSDKSKEKPRGGNQRCTVFFSPPQGEI